MPPRSSARLQLKSNMQLRDKAAVIIYSGHRAGYWQPIGRHEGHQIIEYPDGTLDALTDQEVVNLRNEALIDEYGP